MRSLVKKAQNTIFQHELFKRGAKIILAVSGGPDSVCLLDILSKLQKKYALNLIVAHVNYGLRGRDSKLDEKFVRGLAEKYGLKILILKPKIKKTSENELRDIRYDFFEKLRTEKKYEVIAVAHNADDQVETYLMRLIRGAGLKGLSAMRYKSGHVIRPLLEIKRQEIETYLKKNKLPWRTDKTNLGTAYLRNKIRHRLIPYLEKNFNPRIKDTILSEVKSIAEDLDFLDQQAKKAYRNPENLNVKKILDLHPSLQKRVLITAIFSAKNDLKDIGAAHIGEILKILKSTKGKAQIVIFKGLKITRRGDKLKISHNK